MLTEFNILLVLLGRSKLCVILVLLGRQVLSEKVDRGLVRAQFRQDAKKRGRDLSMPLSLLLLLPPAPS